MIDDVEAYETGVDPHLGVSLLGRFKNCGNATIRLLCIIAARTYSGIQPMMWVKRLIFVMDHFGSRSDWLF
jgi:hypothetical protein